MGLDIQHLWPQHSQGMYNISISWNFLYMHILWKNKWNLTISLKISKVFLYIILHNKKNTINLTTVLWQSKIIKKKILKKICKKKYLDVAYKWLSCISNILGEIIKWKAYLIYIYLKKITPHIKFIAHYC